MTVAMESLIPFDPYDYGFHEDPYPTYARLRARAPVYRNAAMDFWALSKHADVRSAFRDSARLSNSWGVSLDPASYGPQAHLSMSFLAMDDPRHARMRKLVSKGFTPRRAAELTDRVRELATAHWDRCLQLGEFDFVADFAGLLPMDVVSEMLGVPEADRSPLRARSDLLLHREDGVLDVPETAIHAYLELTRYYRELVAERRKSPGPDLISALLEAEIDDDVHGGRTRLTTDEIVGFMVLMIVAGNETTTKLLANAMYWGWRFPDELAKPFADPDMVPLWTEETLRYDTSTQLLLRRVTADVEYGGHTIPAGDRVLLLLGSANRDEDVFENADTFEIGRESAHTLASFGFGIHFCLGAHLARMESNVGLTEIARSIAGFDIDADRAVRVHSVNVRGFAELPMRITPR